MRMENRVGGKGQVEVFDEAVFSKLSEEIVQEARAKHPKVAEADILEVRQIVNTSLRMTVEFEGAAESRERKIHLDTDIVWPLSAVGAYSTSVEFPPVETEDRYQKPWTKGMYRHLVRTGAALIHEITAVRLGKDVCEITKEDIKTYGPWLLFNPAPGDKRHIEAVLAQPSIRIPPEKTFIYYHVIEEDGTLSPIQNTADQVRGLRFPEGVSPRRILIVSPATQLVRILFILDNYRDRVDENTVVQAFPIRIPKGGEIEYPKMEIEAILRYHYDFKKAGKNPYPYEL